MAQDEEESPEIDMFVEYGGQRFRNDGRAVLISEDLDIYNDEAQSWGHFQGSEWVPVGTGTGSSSSRRNKRSRRSVDSSNKPDKKHKK